MSLYFSCFDVSPVVFNIFIHHSYIHSSFVHNCTQSWCAVQSVMLRNIQHKKLQGQTFSTSCVELCINNTHTCIHTHTHAQMYFVLMGKKTPSIFHLSRAMLGWLFLWFTLLSQWRVAALQVLLAYTSSRFSEGAGEVNIYTHLIRFTVGKRSALAAVADFCCSLC